MDEELFEKIVDDIDARKEWANKQPLWHKLRRDGIRRTNKPYPNASDKHFPAHRYGGQKIEANDDKSDVR